MTAVAADVLVLRFLRRSVPHVAYSYHTLHRISARLQMSACCTSFRRPLSTCPLHAGSSMSDALCSAPHGTAA